MNHKHFKNIIIILLLPLVGCNLDQLPEDQLPSFDKLYVVSENVEAVDFICKPDASGYIIAGNLKSAENSDIIIIDVGSDGMQKNLHQIKTPFFDEAVSIKLYQEDNSIVILSHRKSDISEPNVEQNLIIKADLNAIPFRADNTDPNDTVSAEFKILTTKSNTPIQLQDFIIKPPNLICVGNIRQSATGNFSKLTQIFDISSVDFNDKNDSIVEMTRQKPDSIPYNNSRNLKIMEGNAPSAVYEVIAQNISENPNYGINGPSQNINWDIYTDLESSASERIFIGTDKNEIFGDVLYHSNNKNYIAGNYLDSDTLFLISKEYIGINNNADQKITTIADYGNKVVSLTEDEEGNIIMATIEEGDANNVSHILKFSQSGQPIDDQDFVFNSTGLFNIKKIRNESGNILVVLSNKTFENNSTAIGLMKIKF